MTATILLVGRRSPGLVSIAGILEALPYTLVFHQDERPITPEDACVLAVIQFFSRETTYAQFSAQLHAVRNLPVLIIGPDLNSDRLNHLTADHDGCTYLSVGTPSAEKLDVLRRLLRGVTSPSLTAGNLYLTETPSQLRYRQHPVPVTVKEFRLIQALMEFPGIFLPCSTLETRCGCRSITDHVKSVRRKLGVLSAAPLLRGDTTRGYAIDARRHPRASADASFAMRQHLLHLI